MGMLADHGNGIHLVPVVHGCRIKLGAQEIDIIPSRHGSLGSHGCMNGMAGHCDLMNLTHVTAGRILSGIGRIVSQISLESLLRCRFFLLRFITGNQCELGDRLLTDRTSVNLTQWFAFCCFVIYVSADTALINCHVTPPVL